MPILFSAIPKGIPNLPECKLMDRILSWAGGAAFFATLLLTRTLLGGEEVNLVLLGDWGQTRIS